jgi:[acyl-carrier-protein] S-malonyltransferase
MHVEGSVLAFPGQGVDRHAVLDAIADHRDDDRLAPLVHRIGGGRLTPEAFDDPVTAQMAVYLASVLVAGAIGTGGVAAVVGHSLGEIAALTHAGALDVEAGTRLVEGRAALCQDADRGIGGGMVAVMRLEPTALEWLRRRALAAAGGVLEVAGLNGRRQVVLSGTADALDHLLTHVAELGGIGQRLPIAGAFHSPLMSSAADGLGPLLEAADLRAPQVPWLSTIDVTWHDEPASIRTALVQALLLPVRWTDAMEHLTVAGASAIVDVGPGETLHKLGRRAGWPMRAVLSVDGGSSGDPAP